MKKIFGTFFIMLCCFVFKVNAIDKVNFEAFGINIGGNISDLNIINKTKTREGDDLYEVIAKKPMIGRFDSYFVGVTPKTKKIYSIWATKKFNFGNIKLKCVNEQQEIIALLESKYGKFYVQSYNNGNGDGNDKFKLVNNVLILSNCEGRNKPEHVIQYVSKELFDQGEKEKFEIVIENEKDISML